MTDIILGPLKAEERPILWQMLMLAAHEPSVVSVQEQPNLAIYGEGWGRPGDLGVVAYKEQRAIGAAWLRLWGQQKGYGYIDDAIPELAIAVVPAYRGQGVGTQLLTWIIEAGRDRFPGISLSVRSQNPAVSLYQRLGFVRVEGSDVTNRVGGSSFTMVRRFRSY